MNKCRSCMVAVKIIQTYTQLMKRQYKSFKKSILLVSLDNSSTPLFILDNSGLKLGNCCRLVLLFVFSVHKEFQWTRSGQAPSQVGFNSFVCHTVTLQLVVKNVQISSHLICVWTFFFFEKSSMASRLASRLSPMPDLQNNKIRFVNIGLPRSYCKLYKKSIF